MCFCVINDSFVNDWPFDQTLVSRLKRPIADGKGQIKQFSGLFITKMTIFVCRSQNLSIRMIKPVVSIDFWGWVKWQLACFSLPKLFLMEHPYIPFCSSNSVGVCVSQNFIIHWWLLREQIPLTTTWDISTSPHSLWSPMCELWVLTLQFVSLPVSYLKGCWCS